MPGQRPPQHKHPRQPRRPGAKRPRPPHGKAPLHQVELFDLSITTGLTSRTFRVSKEDLNNVFKVQFMVGGRDIILSTEGDRGIESGLRLPACAPVEYTTRPVAGPEQARKHGLYKIMTCAQWMAAMSDLFTQQAMAAAQQQPG